MRYSTKIYLTLLTVPVVGITGLVTARARQTLNGPATIPLVTGKFLTPLGDQTNVGSYPCNLAVSPDGTFVAVTTLGARSRVSLLSADSGKVVGSVDFSGPSPENAKKSAGAYYGLAFIGQTLYVGRGADNRVTALTVGTDGTLTTSNDIVLPSTITAKGGNGLLPLQVAGIAFSGNGKTLFTANNTIDPNSLDLGGSVSIVDIASGQVQKTVPVAGYPLALAAITLGPDADKKIYVTSEQRGNVTVIDPTTGQVKTTIAVGANANALLLNKAQNRLFVSASGSDSVSILDTHNDTIIKTILVRPVDLRGIPAVSPQGLALSSDEKRLFVALSDLNAVAVVDLDKNQVQGFLPTGWYPTAVASLPNGNLFVANAKGVAERIPNDKPLLTIPGRSQYIQNIIEGTVSILNREAMGNLPQLSAQVLKNNRTNLARNPEKFNNPGIEHVIYIIKENRTYDQVLGDLPQGNGDKSVLLFGRDITPNQHALAERFVLLDNFYCCAEVSGDGWDWSTQGMVTPYNSRNVVYGYTGKDHPYDYEGTNNGIPVDLLNVPDASRTPGGYFWDKVAEKKLPFRNYGFFVDDFTLPRTSPTEGPQGLQNAPDKKALVGSTSPDFLGFDLLFADSEAWTKYGLPAAPSQMPSYGKFKDPSRMTTWLRDFNAFVTSRTLPRFMMLRLGRDHTAGTSRGNYSPRAMVADNDYAVGQLVEAVSKSPYWKNTAIFIVEDDAQNGYDHVDAHRSTAYVISPYIRQGTVDSRFYNTDSVLRTMGIFLGTTPLNHYDAAAYPLAVFTKDALNAAPYDAILPAKEIIGEINARTAYRALDSARLLNARKEESGPDEELNDILWHSIKGKDVPAPARHFGFSTQPVNDND
jgi:YVTN family beta-propeller protein